MVDKSAAVPQPTEVSDDDCFGKFRDMKTPECKACTVNKECGQKMEELAKPKTEPKPKEEATQMEGKKKSQPAEEPKATAKEKKVAKPAPAPAEEPKKPSAKKATPAPEPEEPKAPAKKTPAKPAPKKAEPVEEPKPAKKAAVKKAEPVEEPKTPKAPAKKPAAKKAEEPKVSVEEASWISSVPFLESPKLSKEEKQLQAHLQAKVDKDLSLEPKGDVSVKRYLRVRGVECSNLLIRGTRHGVTVSHKGRKVGTVSPEELPKLLKSVLKG